MVIINYSHNSSFVTDAVHTFQTTIPLAVFANFTASTRLYHWLKAYVNVAM
jgi:hypothetical protein